MYQQPPSNQNVPTYTPPEQPYSQYPQPPPQDYPSYPPPPYQQPPQPKRKRRIWLWIVVIVALIVVYQVGHAAITDISATSQAIQPPAATDIPTLAPQLHHSLIRTRLPKKYRPISPLLHLPAMSFRQVMARKTTPLRSSDSSRRLPCPKMSS